MCAFRQLCSISLILCLTGCGPNSRVFQLSDGTEIIGKIPRSSDDAQFFFLNNSDFAKGTHSNWSLRVNGTELDLANVSLEALKDAGAELITPDYAPKEVHATFGWGVQNRDGGVELALRDGRVVRLQLRWHLPTPSPFSITFGNADFLSMPFTESQIHSVFGESIKSNDIYLE
jgi:hypothetical protein